MLTGSTVWKMITVDTVRQVQIGDTVWKMLTGDTVWKISTGDTVWKMLADCVEDDNWCYYVEDVNR